MDNVEADNELQAHEFQYDLVSRESWLENFVGANERYQAYHSRNGADSADDGLDLGFVFQQFAFRAIRSQLDDRCDCSDDKNLEDHQPGFLGGC